MSTTSPNENTTRNMVTGSDNGQQTNSDLTSDTFRTPGELQDIFTRE